MFVPEPDCTRVSPTRMWRTDWGFVYARKWYRPLRGETVTMPAEYEEFVRAERITFNDGSCGYLISRLPC